MAEALGAAIAFGIIVLIGNAIMWNARRKAKQRGDETFISPLSGRVLQTTPKDEGFLR